MDALQKLIHLVEVGGGMRYLRIGIFVVAILLVPLWYDAKGFKNMASQEAMDSAQLARNLAAGDGYKTLFVRPLSMYLLQQCRRGGQSGLGVANAEETGLKGMHPDLANPPVYPFVLAGLMKTLPFHYAISDKPQPFWTRAGNFWRYQPDFLITLFNQLLFFVVIVLTYFLARRIFDTPVAVMSALVLFGTELFWRFTVSGLSTILLLIIFAGLVWTVVLLDEQTRQPRWGAAGLIVLAGSAGLLVGLGGLTRYAFGWLILPLVLFLVLLSGRYRFLLALTALVAFAAIMTPWMARNYRLSHTPFGTGTYTILESTAAFPEYKLQRSLAPDFSQVNYLRAFWQKLIGNSRLVIQDDLPKLGGNWISAFFLAGLLVRFRNPTVRRLRYFLVGCLVTLVIAQALGRTQLSEDSLEINTENLLVLVAPLVLVYGVSLFYLLLEQVELPFREVRYLAMGLFALIACLPLVLTFIAHAAAPIAFPPYYPPSIQTSVGYVKGVENKGGKTDPGELMMSDIPWAVAWYGYSQCVWLPNNVSDFFSINDFQKPINALYLTPQTIDKKYKMADWNIVITQAELAQYSAAAQDRANDWPRQVSFGIKPNILPLHWWQPAAPIGWPYILLLTSRQHWPKDS